MSDLLKEREEAINASGARHGVITPGLVAQDAADPANPLHEGHGFIWDDSEAARIQRINHARTLIQSIKVTFIDRQQQEVEVRAFRHVPSSSGDRMVYRPTKEIAVDPVARKHLLLHMEREWKSFKAKWEHMEEFFEVVLASLPPQADGARAPDGAPNARPLATRRQPS